MPRLRHGSDGSTSAGRRFQRCRPFEDGDAFAEVAVTLPEMLERNAPVEPEIDYVPDPELDFAIADAEALREALTEGPILIAGNRLIN